jgi:small subunit ribosomal protein S2
MESLPKKERLRLRRELEKLHLVLGGVRDMKRPPDVVFVIDVIAEHIAVTEANRLGIPVIAIVDTNCDPDQIDLVIPGNDDAIRTAYLVSDVIAQAAKEGREIREAARKESPAKGAPAGDARGKSAAAKPESAPTPPVEAVVLDEIQAENANVESVVIEETSDPKETV